MSKKKNLIQNIEATIMDESKRAEKKKKEIWFNTGSTLLDLVVGGGLGMGYKSGKIINVVGDKSSGKTFLACEIIAAAYHKYKKKLKWVYDDAESGFTFDTEKLYGFDIIENNKIKSNRVEDWYCNYRNFLKSMKSDEIGIYIMDSLDGLMSKETEERTEKRLKNFNKGEDLDKGTYSMATQKFLSQEFFKTVTHETEKKNVLLIIISQTRDKIDSIFKEQTRSGGRALDFYAHTVLWLASLKKIEKKGRAVGVVVKARTKKSKTPRPFRNCIFTLLFDYGLDNIGSNVDFLFDIRSDSGNLVGNKNSLIWNGEKPTVKTLSNFLDEEKKLAEYKTNVNPKIVIDEVIDYIKKDEGLLKKFDEKFGEVMDRNSIIDYIENNNLESKLEEKIIEKWEGIEDEIKTCRKVKYGTGKK